MNKKGISAIIATVLIIMITIAAAAIIGGVIIPWVKNNLCEKKICYDITNSEYITIGEDFTCYSPSNTSIMIKRGAKNIKIDKIIVALTDKNGESKKYEIIDGETFAGVWMYTTGSSTLAIPETGGSKRYGFDLGNAIEAKIGVVSGDSDCEVTCSGPEEKISIC
ncbi:hypothetical protein FJZ19_03005 [Candidatus Pacearchaeota archaeon]|nr:hypothetical protein [Candidatus Pacearchaeota archaeon]